MSFRAYPGELTAILGGNGTGKTTTLSLIAGLNRPYRGRIRINGTELSKIPSGELFDKLLGVLPQNPQTLFVAKTVREDLLEILSESRLNKQEKADKLRNIAALCRLEGLLDSHPYDLSGGEQQRAALAKVLLLGPRILLLDEPTKGLDAEFKAVFATILRQLTDAGVTVIMVSHDIEFCAEYADRCALFFDGNIVTQNRPRAFFSGNSFYTSAANRMARHILPQAVTVNDVIAALGGAPAPPPELPENGGLYQIENERPSTAEPKPAVKKLTPLRIGVLVASAAAFVATLVLAVIQWEGFSSFLAGGTGAVDAASDPAAVWRYVGLILAFGVEGIAAAAALSWGRGKPEWTAQPAPDSRKLSKRTIAAAAMILLAIPLTIYVGIYYFGDRKYYFVCLLIILEAMLPFALIFERRKPQARELVIIAVLCAIGVAGRVAFFMLPQFKPVTAIVIISGVAFGGEAGFLVGAVTGFVSNMFFGQGPLTPWQMFAFGIIGFLAGVLFRKGLLLRSKTALCTFRWAGGFRHLRRDYESRRHADLPALADMGYALALLFAGHTVRSCACRGHGGVPLRCRAAHVGKTRPHQGQVWAGRIIPMSLGETKGWRNAILKLALAPETRRFVAMKKGDAAWRSLFVVIRPIQMHWKQFYGMDCNGLEIHGIIAADGYYTLILSTGLRPCAMIPFALRVHGIIAADGYYTLILSTGLRPCAMIPFALGVHGIIAVNGYDTFVLSTGLSPCA